jgi:hypothetical protein
MCAFGFLIKTICSHFVIFYAFHTNKGKTEPSYIVKYEKKPYCQLLCDDVLPEKILTFRRTLIPSQIEVKFTLKQTMNAQKLKQRYGSTLSLASALDGLCG